jgi:hypothetical protein
MQLIEENARVKSIWQLGSNIEGDK